MPQLASIPHRFCPRWVTSSISTAGHFRHILGWPLFALKIAPSRAGIWISNLPSNIRFLGLIQLHILNSIKINSLAFAGITIITDRQTNRQAGWFLRPDCAPVPNAPSSECPPASIAARRRAAGSIRISRQASCCCSSAIAGIAIGANFKIYLLCQFCSNRVQFFYNTQETQTQKMMDQNFEIRILWFFENFLKFSKRRLAVPLRPIWTTMVAAKLDHSRVPVTKFRQNRSTLKGRSAGQRQTDTDRQTNLAENNGPSGFQSGQQTTLLHL